MKPTVATIKAALDYDPETGEFFWRPRAHVKSDRTPAGWADPVRQRLLIKLHKTLYPARQLAWCYVYGVWPDGPLAHINGDRLDNRIANLRESAPCLVGRVYGKLTVVERVGSHNQSVIWRCRCECGNLVDASTRSLNADQIAHCGCSIRYKPTDDRFWEKVEKSSGGCWLWVAAKTLGGYGAFHTRGGKSVAHRYAYETLRGPVPAGLDLDHLCRVRHCVNPDHLEPVTRRENLLRGIAARKKEALNAV